jgi:hypothetical protein
VEQFVEFAKMVEDQAAVSLVKDKTYGEIPEDFKGETEYGGGLPHLCWWRTYSLLLHAVRNMILELKNSYWLEGELQSSRARAGA